MVSPHSSFAQRWRDQAATLYPGALEAGLQYDLDTYLAEFHRFRRFASEQVAILPIPKRSKDFLLQNGLPESAAPFLDLAAPGDVFKVIPEVWGVPDDWSDQDRERLSRYRLLYSDGEGNPLCIDEAEGGALAWLDHDDWFNTVRHVNGSVEEFAEYLLRFMIEWQGAPAVYGFADLDVGALTEGSFWYYELATLEANRREGV